jgi:hypothetical protein
MITGLFEDSFGEATNDVLTKYMPAFIATRAIKPE